MPQSTRIDYRKTGICVTCQRETKILAKGMCATCYSNRHRAEHGRKTWQCQCKVCGKHFQGTKEDAKVCSQACKSKLGLQSEAWRQAMSERRANKKPRVLETSEQKQARIEASKGPMRRAYEQGDTEAFFTALQARCTVTSAGCWEWQGKVKSGYPIWHVSGKQLLLHRISVEMKYAAKLGSQAAHHMCGNSCCVNPAHLQPVTSVENTAEMLARRSYEDRIAELEAELRRIDPTNELLKRIEYGAVA